MIVDVDGVDALFRRGFPGRKMRVTSTRWRLIIKNVRGKNRPGFGCRWGSRNPDFSTGLWRQFSLPGRLCQSQIRARRVTVRL